MGRHIVGLLDSSIIILNNIRSIYGCYLLTTDYCNKPISGFVTINKFIYNRVDYRFFRTFRNAKIDYVSGKGDFYANVKDNISGQKSYQYFLEVRVGIVLRKQRATSRDEENARICYLEPGSGFS